MQFHSEYRQSTKVSHKKTTNSVLVIYNILEETEFSAYMNILKYYSNPILKMLRQF